MSVAMKVNIGGCKFLIKGITKETPRKDVLCAIAKFKELDSLSKENQTLSTSVGSLSIVECSNTKRSKQRKLMTSSDVDRKSNCRRKNKVEGKKNAGRNNENRKEENSNLKECRVSNLEKGEFVKSYSFSTKERRINTKRKSRNSSCMDDSDFERIETRNRKFKNSLNKKHYEDYDICTFRSLNNILDSQTKQMKAQIKWLNKNGWFDDVRTQSKTYMIEDCRVLEDGSKLQRRSCENTDWKSDPCGCVDTKNPAEIVSDGTEVDNDSGLPSMNDESSLDAISIEQEMSTITIAETLQHRKEALFRNGGESSVNESILTNEADCSDFSCPTTPLETSMSRNGGESSAKEALFTNEDDSSEKTSIKTLDSSEQANCIEHCKINSELISKYKSLCEEISKLLDELSVQELMITQLEFQLECLTEDEEEDEDIEMEETKLVAELKQTKEFLKAVTYVGQYQKREEMKITDQLNDVYQAIKGRRLRLSSAERRLQRLRFSSIPRHLNISKHRRSRILIIEEEAMTDELNIENDGESPLTDIIDLNDDSLEQDSGSNMAISLV